MNVLFLFVLSVAEEPFCENDGDGAASACLLQLRGSSRSTVSTALSLSSNDVTPPERQTGTEMKRKIQFPDVQKKERQLSKEQKKKSKLFWLNLVAKNTMKNGRNYGKLALAPSPPLFHGPVSTHIAAEESVTTPVVLELGPTNASDVLKVSALATDIYYGDGGDVNSSA